MSAITESDSGIETSAQSKRDSFPVDMAVAEATDMALEKRLDLSDPCRHGEPQHNSTAIQGEVSVSAEADSGIETSAQSMIDPALVETAVVGATNKSLENKLDSSNSPISLPGDADSPGLFIQDIDLIDLQSPAPLEFRENLDDMSQEDLLSSPTTKPKDVVCSKVSASTGSLELSDDLVWFNPDFGDDTKRLVQFKSFLDQKVEHSFGDCRVCTAGALRLTCPLQNAGIE